MEQLSSTVFHDEGKTELAVGYDQPNDVLDAIWADPVHPDTWADENLTFEDAPLPDISSNFRPEKLHAGVSWLDAIPVSPDENILPPQTRIAAIDCDDNNLYRLFRGVSP